MLSELRATLALALPLAAANLAQMAMGLTDTIMVGSLGAVPLAAVGLGSGVYFTSVLVCAGVLNAVAPLASFALGAGDRAAVGRVTASGLLLAVALTLPVIAAMLLAERLLDLLGYEPELTTEIGRYLGAIVWGAPGFLGFAVLRCLFATLSRARVVMVVLVLCVPVNAALNWVLIFGHLGAPPLGVTGAGYASAIVNWLMLLGLAASVAVLPRDDPARRLRLRFAGTLADIRRILALGLPIGGLQALEVGVFVASAALMGLFGADALAAHQIAIMCASFTFMVPMGIGQAATVRVATERGAASWEAARRAGFVALALGTAFMAAAAIVLWTIPAAIVGAFVAVGDPANNAVVALALQFLVIAALFQIVDGMQAVAAGALRGYHDTKVPMLIAGLGYWGVGFVGGWALAFPLGIGPAGLWWGFVIGLATVAVLLVLRLIQHSARELRGRSLSGAATGEIPCGREFSPARH
ncbi:MAG TPA: MATE family efflux transporter [Stellaceae bacterium]|nr:MATE family efflux transporter [Stellaceae bacterium]